MYKHHAQTKREKEKQMNIIMNLGIKQESVDSGDHDHAANNNYSMMFQKQCFPESCVCMCVRVSPFIMMILQCTQGCSMEHHASDRPLRVS